MSWDFIELKAASWQFWSITAVWEKPFGIFKTSSVFQNASSFPSCFCMKKFKVFACREHDFWFDSLCTGGCCGATPQPAMGKSAFSLKTRSLGLRAQPCSSRLAESKSLNRPLLIPINHVKSPKMSLISYIAACHKCCTTSLRCVNSIE